jgi:hypothetical protein
MRTHHRHVRRTLLIVATFNVHHSLKTTVHLRLEFLKLHQLTFGRTLGGLTPTNGNISNLLPCKNVHLFQTSLDHLKSRKRKNGKNVTSQNVGSQNEPHSAPKDPIAMALRSDAPPGAAADIAGRSGTPRGATRRLRCRRPLHHAGPGGPGKPQR